LTEPQAGKDHRTDIDLSAYRALFLDESFSYLRALRESLTQLTENPADEKALSEARRAVHTLRGMASTMQYADLAALGRRLENQFRPESLLTTEQIGVLFSGCDKFEAGLHRLNSEDEQSSDEGDQR
jgi:two-component system chemotaxis sensor kinase CheA